MTAKRELLVLGALCMATGMAAATGGVREITQNCEIALALSAAPDHMHADSGVYVLGSGGYREVRESSNGYYCIVERNHRDSVIPQCFDEGSRDANLAVILDEGRLLRSGSSFEELQARREKALANGEYPSAEPGVVYMVSAYNHIYNARRETMLKVAPHVMFHAPNVADADIGADVAAAFGNYGLPFINAGGPHGFMVAFVERSSSVAEVERACGDQLLANDTMTAFPPHRQDTE